MLFTSLILDILRVEEIREEPKEIKPKVEEKPTVEEPKPVVEDADNVKNTTEAREHSKFFNAILLSYIYILLIIFIKLRISC